MVADLEVNNTISGQKTISGIYLEGEEGDTLAELLEGRPDDGLAGDDAVSAHPHVGEVAPDDGLGLDDVLAVEDDVLGAAEHALATHSVAARGLDVFWG